MDMLDFAHMGHSGAGNFTAGIDGVDNGVMSLMGRKRKKTLMIMIT